MTNLQFIIQNIIYSIIIYIRSKIISSLMNQINQSRNTKKWLLIVFLKCSLVTNTMFVSAYFSCQKQATVAFFDISGFGLTRFVNTFLITYIILTPFLTFLQIRKYKTMLCISIGLIVLGCFGRYASRGYYPLCLVWTIMASIGQVILFNAYQNMLKLFKCFDHQQSSTKTITIALPMLGIIIPMIYGVNFVAKQYFYPTTDQIIYNLHNLNLAIFIANLICLAAVAILIILLPIQFKQQQLRAQAKIIIIQKIAYIQKFKQFLMISLSSGIIIGIFFAYNSMFGIYLFNIGLTNRQISINGLCGCISFFIFCNLFGYNYKSVKYPIQHVILMMNLLGFCGMLLIQASQSHPNNIFRQQWLLHIAFILMNAGFSSTFVLVFKQLDNYGQKILVRNVLYFFAALSMLIANYIFHKIKHSISLFIFSTLVFICILINYIIMTKQNYQKSISIKVPTDENPNINSQNQISPDNTIKNVTV